MVPRCLMALCLVIPAQASVAYIVTCCNYPSTVGVYKTSTNTQIAEWNVGTDAFDAVFSPDGRTAYVSNTGTRGTSGVPGSITLVQVSSGATLATIPVGYYVQWMKLSKDGSRLYAESYDSENVSHLVAIDTATDTVSQALEVSDLLGPLALTPDGATLYVATAGTPGAGNPSGVLVIDAQTLTIATIVQMGVGSAVAITPDGKFLYALSSGTSYPYAPYVAVLDTSTNAVVETIALDPSLQPSYAQVSPDGSMLWVSEFSYTQSTPVIALIQTATNTVSGTISLPGGLAPNTIVFTPDGKLAYVGAFPQPIVEIVDVSTMTVTGEIYPLTNPNGLAVSPNGTTLLIPNSGTTRMAVVSETSGEVLTNIPVGDSGDQTSSGWLWAGVALSPGGSRAYVTNYISANLSVIDTASKKVIANFPTTTVVKGNKSGPVGVLVSSDGSKAYVLNSEFVDSVAVIDTQTFATTQIPFPQYPMSMAISPDGGRLYVSGASPSEGGYFKGFIYTVDTSTNQVVDTIQIWNPGPLAMSPDGANMYLMCGQATIYLCTFSTATNKITNALKLAETPLPGPRYFGIAVTLDGTRVFVDGVLSPQGRYDNVVYEIDVNQNRVIKTIQAGTEPGAMAITPDGKAIWISDYSGTAVSVINVESGTLARTIPLGNQSYAIAFGLR
jgi:YVTN family beta-propeller protein